MKSSSQKPVSGKGSKPAAAKDITVSISEKKVAGAAAGAALGALAAGPVGAVVGGVVGSIVAANSEEVKEGLGSAAKAALKKAPTLRTVEKAVVKAGQKTAVALKSGGAKVKATLVSPQAKSSPKPAKPSKPAAAVKAKPAAAKKASPKTAKAPVKAKSLPPVVAVKKPAGRKK